MFLGISGYNGIGIGRTLSSIGHEGMELVGDDGWEKLTFCGGDIYNC